VGGGVLIKLRKRNMCARSQKRAQDLAEGGEDQHQKKKNRNQKKKKEKPNYSPTSD